MKMNRKRWILTMVVAGFCLYLGSCVWMLTHKDSGEHVPHVSWLPSEATDVSYYRSYFFTAYEFDISEEGYKKWCPVPLSPITEGITVERYLVGTEPEPKEQNVDESLAYMNRNRARVTNGIYFHAIQENGGYVCYVFDRDHKKAYVARRPR